jgi:hypothetical protein
MNASHLLIVLMLVLWSMGCLGLNATTNLPAQQSMTSDECTARGGEIINTLSENGTCETPGDNLGDVAGLKCPCICCKKK